MIYCVEDDAGIRELVVYTLQNTGMEARGLEDGSALSAALREKKPQLILLDIMLPGEDGISILRRLRSAQETAGIPVILLTAKIPNMIKWSDSTAVRTIMLPSRSV